jgi:hypothetical protein
MATAAVAAASARERRRIVEALRTMGAVSTTAAVAPERLGDVRFHMLARLQARGVVRATGDGLLYLDEAAWAASVRMRRRVAAAMLAIALVVIATVVALGAMHAATAA